MSKIINLTYPLIKTTSKMGENNVFSDAVDISNKVSGYSKRASGIVGDAHNSKLNSENTNIDKHYVTFIPMVIKNSISAKAEEISKITDIKEIKIDSLLKNLADLANDVKNSFSIKGFRDNLTTSILKDGTSLYISLPAKPTSIDLQHRYTDVADTRMGDVIGAVASGDIGKMAAEALKFGAFGLASGAGGAGGAVGNIVNQSLASSGINTAAPKRKIFSGTEGISLNFQWDMSPKNQLEAAIIKKIVTAFKFLSTVQSIDDGEGEIQSSFPLTRTPAIWRIDYDNGSETAQDIAGIVSQKVAGNKISFSNMMNKNNSFEFMVCTKCTVKYGDGEFWKTFSDGFPNTINLSLMFEQMFPLQTAQETFGKNAFEDLFEKKGKVSELLGQFGF